MTHPNKTEHGEQSALFKWKQYMVNQGTCPGIEWMYAVPNWRPKESERAYLAEEGVSPGVPDVHLPVSRRGYLTMYIEMKIGENKPTKDQKRWLKGLAGLGHYTVTCWSCDEAIKEIEWYLGGEG